MLQARKRVVAAGLQALIVMAAPLASAAAGDDAPFDRKIEIHATAISSELLDLVVAEDIDIRSQAAIQSQGQINVSSNEHFEDFEVLEAATFKPDGKEVDVPPDRILVSGLPNASTLMMFKADVKIRTIVFPDVAVGDRLHLKYRVRQKEAQVPGGFAIQKSFPASARVAAAEITVDVPEGLALAKTVSGMTETSNVSGGRRHLKWVLQPVAYQPDVPGETSPMDRDPRLLVSSYPSDEAMGGNFYRLAASASVPSAEVQAKAEDVTKGITDRREQARAIYDYVSKNVRYMAIFLGNGGYVPHDAGAILAAKYGDCKDHATLMRAMLAAKGIDADYTLIAFGNGFKSDPTPAPGKYNHLIVYIPEFDLYADPTQAHASFGNQDALADKPVLRAGVHGVVATRTPPLTAGARRMLIKADVTLRPDGTPTGTSDVTGYGVAATTLRGLEASAALKGPGDFAKQLLEKQKWFGIGSIELRDPTDHTEPYVVKTTFDLRNRFFGNGPNPNRIPYGPSVFPTLFGGVARYLSEKQTLDMACQPGVYELVIDVHLPAGKALSKVPANIAVTAGLASYAATYALSGQTLHVTRKFTFDVKSSVCTMTILQAMRPAIAAAAKDAAVHLQFAGEAAVSNDIGDGGEAE